MRPVLKLTSVVVIASCLFIASLFSIWAAPTNDQSISRLLPPASRPHLIQSSQAITFTPVATIYLPLVMQGGTPLPNNPPNIPSDPSPPHNATNVDVMINLAWSGGDPDAGDTVTYDVYLNANNSTPNTLICNDNSTTTCDPPGNLLYNTDYYWKVVATDNHDASSTSSIWHFKTGAAPCNTPGTPTLVSPGNGTTINDNTPTFDWNTASNATEYQLQVDNNANFSSPEIDTTTASTDYTPTSGLSDGTYSWRVRGHNSGGSCDVYGSWSSVWSVIIDTPEPCPPPVPGQWSGTGPAPVSEVVLRVSDDSSQVTSFGMSWSPGVCGTAFAIYFTDQSITDCQFSDSSQIGLPGNFGTFSWTGNFITSNTATGTWRVQFDTCDVSGTWTANAP